MKLTQTLRQFAFTDGLVKGTAITSNLVSIACISVLPGFGENGLLISNTIQMLASGILEIPTGFFADRRGWQKAVHLGFLLKFLVSVFFVFALIASFYHYPQWVWIFFALEAITDAFASTFMSGSYQAAYLEWYSHRNRNRQSPPLFLASFEHATRIRFLLPTVIILSAVTIQTALKPGSSDGQYELAFLLFGVILSLRLIVMRTAKRDLKGVPATSAATQIPYRDAIRVIGSSLFRNSNFYVYANSVFINAFAVFYLVGTLFKKAKQVQVGGPAAWAIGIFIGLAIYLTRTAVSTYLFPRLAVIKKAKGLIVINVAMTLATILSSLVLLSDAGRWVDLFTLFIMGVFCTVSSDATQRYVDSNLATEIEHSFKASWVSCANALGYFFFGALSGIVLLFGLQKVDLLIFSGCVAVTTLGVTALIVRKTDDGSAFGFSTLLRNEFKKVTIAVLLLISMFDLGFVAVRTYRNTESVENSISHMVTEAARDPVSQGGFVEATRRLMKFQSDKITLCSELRAWDFRTDKCNPELLKNKMYIERRVPLYLGSERGEPFGELKLFLDRTPFYSALLSRALFDLFLLLSIALLLHLFFKKLGNDLTTELSKVLKLVEGGTVDSKLRVNEFQTLCEHLIQMMNTKASHERTLALSHQAKQVAHDIRSPLAALEMLSELLGTIEEDKRLIFRGSINRIRDIANSLRESNVAHRIETTDAPSGQLAPSTLLAPVIESIVTEKRIQYRDRLGIQIEYYQSSDSYGLFSKLESSTLKRVISNLIDNSVDAAQNKRGSVEVRLGHLDSGMLEIVVSDNGCGIPNQIRSELGKRGITYGKKDGTGLGLHHAFETIKAWNGQIEVNSVLGQGTQVRLKLKKEAPPAWFVDQLTLTEDSRLVVLDDDISMHQIWGERLSRKDLSFQVPIHHFTQPKNLREFFRRSFFEANNDLYLMDYELIDQTETGLDLIAELGISDRAILVTSYYEDDAVREQCERLKVRLIPKSMSGFVPIEVTPLRTPPLVGLTTEKIPAGSHRQPGLDRA